MIAFTFLLLLQLLLLLSAPKGAFSSDGPLLGTVANSMQGTTEHHRQKIDPSSSSSSSSPSPHKKYAPAYREWNNHVSYNEKGEPIDTNKYIPTFIVNEKDGNPVDFSGHRPYMVFDIKLREMSEMFAKYNLPVNFANIGACDGKEDNTQIEYWRNDNLRGLFIEPNKANVRDFMKIIDEKGSGVKQRSAMIHAAVTDKCVNSYVNFSMPPNDPDNKIDPHWIRRQIGKIRGPELNPDWFVEQVKCLSFEDIMADFYVRYNSSRSLLSDGQKLRNSDSLPHRNFRKLSRVHAVKIDTEGHDHVILDGIFKNKNIPPHMWPLIILFETKGYMEPVVKKLREMMMSYGYSTSSAPFRYVPFTVPYEDDMIAILHTNKIPSSGQHKFTGRVAPKHNPEPQQ